MAASLQFGNERIDAAHGEYLVRREGGRLDIHGRGRALQLFVAADEEPDARRVHEPHAGQIEHDAVAGEVALDELVRLAAHKRGVVFVQFAAQKYVQASARYLTVYFHCTPLRGAPTAFAVILPGKPGRAAAPPIFAAPMPRKLQNEGANRRDSHSPAPYKDTTAGSENNRYLFGILIHFGEKNFCNVFCSYA